MYNALADYRLDNYCANREQFWRDYWSRSAVELADKELERLWYHNQYWLGCCLREGKVAPGLLATGPAGKSGRHGTAITT